MQQQIRLAKLYKMRKGLGIKDFEKTEAEK